MFGKIQTILSINDRKKFYLLFLIIFFVIFIEMLGVSLIPIYILLISDQSLIIEHIPFENIKLIITSLEENRFIIISSILLFSVFFLKNLILGFFIYFQGKIIVNFNRVTNSYLFNYYIRSNYLFYVNSKPSEIIRTLNTDIGLAFNLIQSILKLMREFLLVVLMLTAMLIINFKIYFFTFALFFCLLIIFYFLFKEKLKKKGKLYQQESSKNIKIIGQSFNSLKEIKISKTENFFLNTFNFSVRKLQELGFFNYLITTLPRLFLEIFAIGLITIFTLVFFYLDLSLQNFIPLISVLAVACIRFIPAFNNIVSSINTIKFYQPSLNVVSEAIKNFKSNMSAKEKIISNLDFEFNEKIEIKNLNFKYQNSKKNVIKNLSITLNKGGIYAISGGSGSGKTTLINLIMGFLSPDSGSIRIDNFNVLNNLSKWQAKIGYIPQNVYLLDETLRENIAFGINERDIDEKKLHNAINLSRLNTLVSSLPNGVLTNIGNMGNKISGGQRQRIGIARALYNNPDLLIFDEATNSLDKKTEGEIFDDIFNNKEEKTLIIISHQKTFFKKCDKVFNLDDEC